MQGCTCKVENRGKYQNVGIGYSQGNTELYQQKLYFFKDLLQTCMIIAVYVLDLVVVIMIAVKRITLEQYLTLIVGWRRCRISL